MAYNPLFVNSQLRGLKGKQLPMISQDLDSVRAHQFEITFYNVPVQGAASIDRPITLAAKQVSQIGMQSEDVVVHRVNDVVYYPGKTSPEELRVTFDNLYKHRMGRLLYDWFKNTTYNPETGEMTPGRSIGAGNISGNFKIVADVVELGNTGQPISYTRLYGVYPKAIREAERNYATNDFHTVEVSFRYDFMVKRGDANT